MLVNIKINGHSYEFDVTKKDIVLNVLRNRLGLTGTKFGCGTGDCGACKILLDGEAVNSCTLPAWRCDGKEIVTIEGIGNVSNPHPIQEAFVEGGAIQCGFCTPGMIITAKALLDKNSNPTEEEIRESFKNNLCRCTGYVKIIDSVKKCSKES